MAELKLEHIGEAYRQQLFRQTYDQKPPIQGVELLDLPSYHDDSGLFVELARLDETAGHEAFVGFQVRQVNYSELAPGAVKGWHLHLRQDDLWFIPPGDRLLVGLLDVRADSPTFGLTMRFTLGDNRCRLLRIPAGVAHGVANPNSAPGRLFYCVNQQFRAGDADEWRLPWDICGSQFWTSTPG